MSNSVYINNHIFYFSRDLDEVRNSSEYIVVRQQINRKNAIFTSGIDWGLIKLTIESLGRNGGIDLLLSGYYCVACAKLQGLTGFTNGLELIISLLNDGFDLNNKTMYKYKEMLEWVGANSIKEIKSINPNHSMLRDLYRCEFYCEKIHNKFEDYKNENMPTIEGIAFIIFEHIDKLETQHLIFSEHTHNNIPERKKLSLSHYFWILSFVIITLLLYVGEVKYQTALENINKEENFLSMTPSFLVGIMKKKQSYKSIPELVQQVIQPDNKYAQDYQKVKKLKNDFTEDVRLQGLIKHWEDALNEQIQSVDKLVERFKKSRTKLVNMLEKNKNKKDADYVDIFSKSLSPIYSRVAYIEDLIIKGEKTQAQDELDVLNNRINSLKWKVTKLTDDVIELDKHP